MVDLPDTTQSGVSIYGRRPKVGLVLSGGGVRGAYQVGAQSSRSRLVVGRRHADRWNVTATDRQALGLKWCRHVVKVTAELAELDLFVDERMDDRGC